MTGDLKINGLDAFSKWGISLQQTALTELMTPAPNKDYITSEARLENGTRYIVNPNVGERDVTLLVNLIAKDEETFLTNYSSFCEELAKGKIEIWTRWQPDVKYRLLYKSCSQYSQFLQGLAKFTLKMVEPNPKNRALDDD